MAAVRKPEPGKKVFGLNGKSLVLAVVIHVVIGVLLFASFNFKSDNVAGPAGRPEVQPVQASVVTEAEVKKQFDAIEERENKKKLEQERAERKVQDLLKKQKQEEQKLAQIKKEQEQQKVKAAAEVKKAKALARKKEEEKNKKAELARKKKEDEKKAELARKKKADEKKKAELALKKKEEEKKKKLADDKRKKELALQQQMEAERQARVLNSALAQYIPIITQKVGRNWNQPTNLQRGITAIVAVRLTANGEVVSAQLTRSSGDSVFDRSVVNAVYKASPLPIPRERGVNEKFRELNLNFNPEDLI
jgi:colicin import membrane protein